MFKKIGIFVKENSSKSVDENALDSMLSLFINKNRIYFWDLDVIVNILFKFKWFIIFFVTIYIEYLFFWIVYYDQEYWGR